MQSPRNDRHQDRAKSSEAARKAAQARFAALAPKLDDPTVIERMQARVAVAEARQERIAKRAAELRAAAEAQAAAAAAATAAAEAEAAALRAQAEEAERERLASANAAKAQAIELMKQQKLARDARYAARQSRRK
ncbi:hypothetical protein EJV46_20990 [Roseococcus sp. SYP-B2431]|uniref:DUF6481 family protein n=1 Tax=Roseococcus sp. SYP-B2431 TaxID=2496640 RepID=UPI00103E4016|nr:DUF6481 family protein [Roseococcus sp. SYP-B2431]TCH96454.1 hypothetical protein EJV46_20990 [Roseococcus sp. SYP-B2431]